MSSTSNQVDYQKYLASLPTQASVDKTPERRKEEAAKETPTAKAFEKNGIKVKSVGGNPIEMLLEKDEYIYFYSVQDAADALRIKTGGVPWPNDPDRAHLGAGIYAWGSLQDAQTYLAKKQARGIIGLEIVTIKIEKNVFTSLDILDLTNKSDEFIENWLNKHSSLYGEGLPHNFEYVKRMTGMDQVEHYLSENIYHHLKFE